MLITFFKASLLGAYALALASLFLVLPMEAGPVVQRLALALLAVHALECLVAFKYIKSYAGSVYLSFVLAIYYLKNLLQQFVVYFLLLQVALI